MIYLFFLITASFAAYQATYFGPASGAGDGSQGGSYSPSGHTAPSYEQQTIGNLGTIGRHHDPMVQQSRQNQDQRAQFDQKTQNLQAQREAQIEYTRTHSQLKINKNIKDPVAHMRKIDLGSISDLREQDLPFRLESNGEFRNDLDRLQQDLSKIRPRFTNQIRSKELGLASVREADSSYVNGQLDDAQLYRDMAEGFLDLAVGLDPLTGFARSSYEFATGKNFITGSDLSTFERSLAFVGVVSLGGGRSAMTLAKAFGKIGPHALKYTASLPKAIQEATAFLKTGVGRIYEKIRTTGRIEEDIGYQFYEKSASTALMHPPSETFARLVPGEYAADIAAGIKPLSKFSEAFITAEEDVVHLRNDLPKLSNRLGLFNDKAGTIPREIPKSDVLLVMKIKREDLAKFEKIPEGTYNMHLPGAGKTTGGAREWITDPEIIKKLKLKVKIVRLDQ